MKIPSFFDSIFSIVLFGLLLLIVILGIVQFVRIKTGKVDKVRSLVPVGALAITIGILGYINGMIDAFNAIEAAGDISPQIVAASFSNVGEYLVLGLISLAFSFVFRFVNQNERIF